MSGWLQRLEGGRRLEERATLGLFCPNTVEARDRSGEPPSAMDYIHFITYLNTSIYFLAPPVIFFLVLYIFFVLICLLSYRSCCLFTSISAVLRTALGINTQ